MKTTTLRTIKGFNPCAKGWKKLLRSLDTDESDLSIEVSYAHILESNGLDDVIWSLRTNPKLALEFAISCAEHVLAIFEKEYPEDKRPQQAIEAAKICLTDSSKNAADAAARAARAADAAAYAARAAADAAADAADAAAYAARAAADAAADAAAYAAADAAEKEWQRLEFIKIVS